VKLQTGLDEAPDLRFVVDHEDRVSQFAHRSTAPLNDIVRATI
jgi:hypothetical protein